jgi:hypothetical protein
LHLATPADRDRAIDVLRAAAIAGVVLGHWLVTAVVQRADGHLADDSPLTYLPAFTPASWLLQPLAIFFLVGGWAAARGYGRAAARGTGYARWLTQRWVRLLRPIGAFAAVWIAVWIGMVVTGTPSGTIRTLTRLAYSPLWFILVYAALTALTPLVLRHGLRVAACAAVVVAGTDAAWYAAGPDGWSATARWLNLPMGWLVPYALGAAWAGGRLTRRRGALALVVLGAGATVALVRYAGYPASMVGVPGGGMSNLNPPSLAAVSFGLAQCGAAILLAPALRRLAGRARTVWAVVATVNLSAITVFLWHQTALLLTTLVPLAFGMHLAGLQTAPDRPAWVLERLGWIPVFTAVLLVFWLLFRGRERDVRH